MKFKELHREDRKPIKFRRINTVNSIGSVKIEITDDEGRQNINEYGIVNNEDIYKLIKAGKKVNIDQCFVESFSLYKYREMFNIKDVDTIIINNFSADKAFFDGEANFNNARFCVNASFMCATFNAHTDFSSAKFMVVANFSLAKFNVEALFNTTTFNECVNFDNAKFTKYVDFNEATFSKKADFSLTIFSGFTLFKSAIFSKVADFRNAQFSLLTDFGNMQFYEGADFSFARFKGDLYWIKTKFEKATLFTNAFFEHSVNFSELEFGELDLTGVVFDKYALFKDTIINEGNRETFRVIKNEFMRTNNRIDSLDYHRREMEAFERELKDERIKKDKKYWGKDEIVLKLNKFTNNYGSSWQQALLLTMAFAIGISEIMAIFGQENSYFTFFWEDSYCWTDNYCPHMIVLNTLDVFLATLYKTCDLLIQTLKFDYDTKLNLFGKGLSLIARLGVGYGYFQIIQAFRKFKIW